ncbi:hypothetical protein M8J75_004550 [Diaphorina citri]|nr:hypothetical protein M8J75_004550 [Diaphorina citri]
MDKRAIPNIVNIDITKVEINELGSQDVPNGAFIPQVIHIDRKYVDSITTINIKEEPNDITEAGENDSEFLMRDYQMKEEYDNLAQIMHESEDSRTEQSFLDSREGNLDQLVLLELNGNENQPSQQKSYKLKTCLECNLSFRSKKLLREHTLIEHKNINHKCGRCKSVFTREKALKKHACYHCKICDKFMAHKFKFHRHMRIHADEDQKRIPTKWDQLKYECSYCSQIFAVKIILKRHIETKHYGFPHPKDNGPILCPICNKPCNSVNQRVCHLRDTHQTKVNIESNVFFCIICEQSLRNLDELILHLSTDSHEVKKVQSKRTYLESTCLICNRVFTRFSHSHAHMKEVHWITYKYRQFTCIACDELFTDVERVKEHVESERHNLAKLTKAFRCNTCGKTFLYAKSLATHEKRKTVRCTQTEERKKTTKCEQTGETKKKRGRRKNTRKK